MQGKEIGKYYIKGYLKQGGYGKVYLAQSLNKKLYALKHINHTKQEKEYVIKEAERYKNLDHPNIIKLVEYFEDPKQKDHMAIVLEYCSKKDLSECLLNDKEFLNSLDKQRSIQILKNITNGLVYLHSKNIIHRDIKPCNILMTEDYLPKIGDLGSSKDTQNSLNTGNNDKGTWTYLAPQICDDQYKQNEYTSKTDIWPLGIIALELLLKRKSSTFVKPYCPAAMINGFPPENLLNEIEDKSLQQLVRKMLTKDPKKRPTSIEVLNSLQTMIPKVPVSSKQILIQQKRQQINTQEALKKVNQCFISLHKAIVSDKITLREVFESRVNKKSGKFGIMQFTKLISSINKTLELEQIQQVFGLIDSNHSETIEYDELNRHYCQVNELAYSEENLKKKEISKLGNNQNLQKKIDYRFSYQQKAKIISAGGSDACAYGFSYDEEQQHNDYEWYMQCGMARLVLIDGPVQKQGSSISFRVKSKGHVSLVQNRIRNKIVQNGYHEDELSSQLLSLNYTYYNRDEKGQRIPGTQFYVSEGDVVKIQTKVHELLYFNQRTNKEFRMKLNFTEKEWQQACFCAYLQGQDTRGMYEDYSRFAASISIV